MALIGSKDVELIEINGPLNKKNGLTVDENVSYGKLSKVIH